MIRTLAHLLLLTIVVLACHEQGANGTESRAKHDSATIAPVEDPSEHSAASITVRPLIGTWAMTGDTHMSFRLSKDSLYYPNNTDGFLYRATPDSIHFYMDGYVNDFAWKIRSQDTLEIIVDTAQSHFYYRLK
ncbi:hypothetical protein [Pseudoflavitalea rhizosphaerae]|uniref:hypothetical protein n=1 Tax=Pseudoflavitalea rhizosphaerae TaxID=1884793 RepID=UPI000F8E840E|nr:hypothetical protein [Pseudoflavitalea rhizosphaerae]